MAAFCLTGALASSCTTASPTAGTERATAGFVAPRGVYVDPAERRDVVDGLFNGARDPVCCWLAPQARVRFFKRPGTTTLVLVVSVIDIPRFRAAPASLGISAAGASMKFNVRPGVHTVRFRLPSGMRRGAGPYLIEIESSAFTPAVEHVTGDTRRLGIMLRSIDSV